MPAPISVRTQQRINRRRARMRSRTRSAARAVSDRPRPTAAPPSGPAAQQPTTAAAEGYDWGDGRKVHSISLADHRKHVQDKKDAANPLYNPVQQLSGTSLRDAAGDLVDLEFGPQRAALARELSNVTTQGTALAQRAGDYSQQLAANDAKLPTQVGAIGDMLNRALDANNTAATTAIQGAVTDAQGRVNADQAVRGVIGGDQMEGVNAETAKQLETLAANTADQKGAAAAQTAAYQQLADLSGKARAQMGQEIQGQLLTRLANNQGDVRARQADLAAEEGPARTQKLLELRQQAFENLLSQRGLDIKSSELEAETAEGKARIEEQAKARRQRARDAKANRDLRKQLNEQARTDKANETNSIGIKNSDWVKMTNAQRQKAISDFNRQKTADTTRPGAGAKPKPMSQQARDKRTRIDSMMTDIQNDPKLTRHRFETGPRLVEILVNRGADPLEAQAAAEIMRHGALTPATEAKLRRAGIRIPRAWRGTKATGRDAQPG